MNDIQNYEVNLDKLAKRVEELRSQEKNLTQQQEALTNAFKQGKISEQQYQKAMEGLRTSLSSVANSQKQLGKVIDEQKKQLQQSAQGIEKAFGAIWGAVQGGLGQIANGFQQMREKAAAAVKELTDIWNNIKAIRADIDKFGGKQQAQQEKDLFDKAVKNGDIEAQRLYLQKQKVKAVEEETKAKQKLEEATKKAAAAQSAYDNRGRWVTQGKNDAVTLSKKVEAAEKAMKDAQDAVLTAANNLTNINKDLATLSEKEDERKKKADEERLKREKEIADQRKKAAEEQKKADEDAIKQLEDLRIKCISDETRRRKAQIELEKRRAIASLNKIAEKAGENGKKAVKEAISLLEKFNINEVMNIDSAKMQDTYSRFGVDMTQIMRNILLDYEKELAEEPVLFVKEVGDRLYTLSAPLDQSMQQWIDNFCKEYEDRFKLGVGGITEEFYENTIKAAEQGLVTLTNGYNKILNMSEEEVRTLFDNANIKSLANPDNYKEYLSKVTESLNEIRKISPQYDKEIQIQAKAATHELDELAEAAERFEMEDEKLNFKAEELTDAEQKRFEHNKKQIEALAIAEAERLNNLFPEIDKVRHELEELRKDAGWTDEEFVRILDERIEKTSNYKDYFESMQANEKELNTRIEQLKITHEASMKNIEANAQNERIILQQEYADKVRAIEEERTRKAKEEAEKRKQLISDEFNNASSLVGGMGDMFNALGQIQSNIANDESKSAKEREKARKKQLNLQIAATFMSMASGLASGIANAVEAGWPMMLVSIPATVAMLIAEFAQVKSIMAQKNSGSYADGGLIGGQTQKNSRADNLTANVSAGEYVVNSNATANNLPLLDSINYGSSNNNVLSAIVGAIGNIKPTVAVETIENVQTAKNQIEVYSHM